MSGGRKARKASNARANRAEAQANVVRKEAADNLAIEKEKDAARIRAKGKGVGGTLLTSGLGLSEPAPTRRKTLLG